jgi:hypothetical protein
MKFGKDAVTGSESDASREEVREMAEALSLYRSAVHHIVEREAAKPFVVQPHQARSQAFGLLLAPALAAVIAVGVLIPVYNHFHHGSAKPAALGHAQPPAPEAIRANVDDTVLMNQIDSEVSEDVPDALRPLAELSDQTTTTNAVSEKKDVTHE